MNKIKFGLGTEYDPSLRINIDDIDIFTVLKEELINEHKPAKLTSFLFNEWEYRKLKFLDNPRKIPRKNDVFNGIMLIGICSCGIEGCADLSVRIVSNKNTTTWKIYKTEFVFDAIEYKNEIKKLIDNYYSYSWESEEHKINRVCTEYIRSFKTNNNIFNSDIVNDIIEIYYYDELPKKEDENIIRNWKIKWDGKSIEADYRLINELDDLFEENIKVMWTMEKAVIQNRILYKKNYRIIVR